MIFLTQNLKTHQLPDVTAYRYYENSTGILSLVYASWVHGTNYFLERPWLDNEQNLSCIPADTYKVVWDYSNKFGRYTWHIISVPARLGIRIHPGNTIRDSLGCPLTGLKTGRNQKGELAVWNSRSSLENFEHLVDREKPSNKWFKIHFIDLFPFRGRKQ